MSAPDAHRPSGGTEDRADDRAGELINTESTPTADRWSGMGAAQVAQGPGGSAMTAAYGARRTNRTRATKAEMVERAAMLTDLAAQHGPCSVRHLFYASVVAGVPGITKDQSGYSKVQRQVLELRRSGDIAYRLVVDSTRWMRKPRSFDSMQDALEATARLYRRNLWNTSPWRVEVWCESDSIAGTIYEATARWDVPLMVCRGYASESFAFTAAEAWRGDQSQPAVLYVGDHDPAGLEIEHDLKSKLTQFADREVEWSRVGVRWDQVEALDLPGTAPKVGRKKCSYPFPMAVEAEALPANYLRTELDQAIRSYVDEHQLDVTLAAEQSERNVLMQLAGKVAE